MKISGKTGDSERDKREAEIARRYQARMRLEAAASDLLSALKALAVTHRGPLCWCDIEASHLHCLDLPRCRMVRAVVAKAEGGAA